MLLHSNSHVDLVYISVPGTVGVGSVVAGVVLAVLDIGLCVLPIGCDLVVGLVAGEALGLVAIGFPGLTVSPSFIGVIGCSVEAASS